MRDFDYSDLKNKTWDHEILSYVAKIHEYKGRQALFLQQEPVELQRLIEVAMIQSTESSNRIEGIVTTRSRLLQLVENKTTPRNHDEKEILGYRNVLNIIHSSYEYKTAPNEIEQICDNYQKALDLEIVDPLILIPCVIFDFLCVHPFHDGNGRMSHLLTLLLLYRNGYMVGKYISIEKEIADTKEAYYQALEQADAGWHEGANDPTPFIKYMLGILLKCYREFEERLTISEKSGKRSTVYDIVKNYAISTLGTFTKKDVVENCPSVARSSIEAALKKLVDDGTLHRKGKGRSSHYIRSDSTK